MFVVSKNDQKIQGVKDDLADRFIYEKIGRDGAIILWQLQVKPGSEKPKRGKEIFISNEETDPKIYLWKEVF